MRLTQLINIIRTKRLPDKMEIIHYYTHLNVEDNKEQIKTARRIKIKE